MARTQPLVRVAALATYLHVAEQVGLKTQPLLKKAGLDIGLLKQPDQFVPIIPAVALLEESARLGGCAAFGLRMALDRPISTDGLISVLLALQPTMDSLVQTIRHYRNSLSPAILLNIERCRDIAVLTADLALPADQPHRQASEFLLAVLVNMIRFILGKAWHPERAHLAYPTPPLEGREYYQAALGPRTEFNATFNGLTVALADLDRARESADPLLADQAAMLFEPFARSGDAGLAQRVQETIVYLLGSSRASLAETASLLGMHPRLLQRCLSEEGTNYSELVRAVRRRLAGRFLRNPQLTIAAVAEALGFFSSAAFSRWHRQEFGRSPTQARAAAH